MDYDSAFQKLLRDTSNEYSKLLESQRRHLSALQDRLSERLRDSVTSQSDLRLDWKNDEKTIKIEEPTALVRLSDRGFEAGVASFGHGLQRAFLISLLQEILTVSSEESPTLILAVEEPELYQHPPQARHLADVLHRLSDQGSQVLLTTHSSFFVNVESLDGLHKVIASPNGLRVASSSLSDILNDHNLHFERPLNNLLQVRAKLGLQLVTKFSEMFFCDRLILVEGVSDAAYIEAYLRHTQRHQEFRRRGMHVVVAEGKSSLVLLLLIARAFEIDTFCIFDGDADCKPDHRQMHERENNIAFRILGNTSVNGFPSTDFICANFAVWRNSIEEFVDQEYGEHRESCLEAGRQAVGFLRDSRKNPMAIAAAMDEAYQRCGQMPGFERLVAAILRE